MAGSKKLREIVRLSVDIVSNRGDYFTKSEVVEEANRSGAGMWKNWSLEDQTRAHDYELMRMATSEMKDPYSPKVVEHLYEDLPAELWPVLENCPRNICVQRGGKARWISIFDADVDDFKAARAVRKGMRDHILVGEERLAEVEHLLKESECRRLQDYINKKRGVEMERPRSRLIKKA
jgi:hypothetical protein